MFTSLSANTNKMCTNKNLHRLKSRAGEHRAIAVGGGCRWYELMKRNKAYCPKNVMVKCVIAANQTRFLCFSVLSGSCCCHVLQPFFAEGQKKKSMINSNENLLHWT